MELQKVVDNYFFDSLYDNDLKGVRFVRVSPQGEENYEKDVACSDKKKLLDLICDSRWFTPNVFNLSKCGRIKKNVQFITTFALEFDCYLPSPIDVLDKISEGGLMPPHFLVRSKTPGHWHVYWLIDPIAAYSNNVTHHIKISRLMAQLTGADIKGVGVERWFAVPKGDIYQYAHSDVNYTYQEFKDWYETNNDIVQYANTSSQRAKILKLDVFGHPAIQKLLKGSQVGQRDNSCFTLALLYYSQSWEIADALSELMRWNERNELPMKIKEIKKCLKSAYSGKYRGPSASYIEILTGIPFKMRIMREYKGEKTYQKLYDIEYRILQLIRKSITLSMSQSNIAKKIEAPLRSVKKAIKQLIDQKRIIATGGGAGKGNVATYSLENQKWKKVIENNKNHKNIGPKNHNPRGPEISESMKGANSFTSFSSYAPDGGCG
ncbi:primase C-terminal domain-containing protein [Paenibacillus macquariensis]|uniref:Primase C terminal 1 (PriCT-1) n=1 Tax=Paenibacillus macquariensis TaxID=948756 RepID=A0ABY1KEL8_9BACL|nr:primase C-terminal domain-containing protein [Paenibacillus macquariensis]OAB28462.1 hypothetical protein PMSM_24365 [Paenibacillus macquariensis subsp. macquariensis]SIR71838.1 Primase C terminal 1 (PriCT-1) [Paenibacillus macquariensis]